MKKGSGIIDRLKRSYETIKNDGVFGVRNNYNFKSKETITKYGSWKILKCWAYRKPIENALEGVLNLISSNKFDEMKKKLNYDTLYHLGLFCLLNDGFGRYAQCLVEKNAVIEISIVQGRLSDYGETVPVYVNQSITLLELLNNCQKAMGEKYFLYDAFNQNNCQVFCLNLLKSSNLLTESLEKFIFQPLDDAIEMIPKSTPVIARFVTDMGAWFDRISGGNLKTIKKGGRLPPKEQILKAVKENKDRLEAQEFDPQYDEILNKREQLKRIIEKNPDRVTNKNFLKKTEAEKARYFRTVQNDRDERNATQQAIWDEEERMRKEEENKNPFLDVFTGIVSAFDPTGLAETGIDALRSKLEGRGLTLHAIKIHNTIPKNKHIDYVKDITKSNKNRLSKTQKNFTVHRITPKTKFEKGTLETHNTHNKNIKLIFGILK